MKKTPLILVVALAAGGFVYWRWFFHTPLDKGRKLLDQGDPAGAVEALLKGLDGKNPPAQEQALRGELARAYLMRGAYDNAEEQFRLIAEKFPEDGRAHLGLGFIRFGKGFDGFALESFRRAKELLPDDLRPSLGLAGLHGFRGDWSSARDEYLHILNRAPLDRGARRGLGWIFLKQGLYREAAAEFEAALEGAPEDPETRRLLAESRLGAGELEAAEQGLRAVLDRQPDDLASRILWAELLRATGRSDEALSLMESLYSEDARRLTAGLKLALWRAQAFDAPRAETLLLDIAQRLPKPEDVAAQPASNFYDPWETLELKNRVRRLRLDFHLASAHLYAARGLYGDAERQARQALALHGRDLEALRFLIRLRRSQNDPDARIEEARKASEAYPQHPDVLLDEAEAALALRRPQEALTFAQAAAAACPSSSRAAAVLARVQLALGLKQQAAAAAERAVALNPRGADGYLSLGLARRALGRTDEAVEAFSRAIQFDPVDARVWWELGLAYEAQKKPSRARAQFAEAARLEPLVYGKKRVK